MKTLDIILMLILTIMFAILIQAEPCYPQEPQPTVKELLEKVSDLEKNINYAIYTKQKLFYLIWITKDITKVHIKEAKGYSTTGNFHYWSGKYKPNPKIDFSEEP